MSRFVCVAGRREGRKKEEVKKKRKKKRYRLPAPPPFRPVGKGKKERRKTERRRG